MYKQCIDSLTNNLCNCVIRISDNAFIPFDPDNTDYQAFTLWLEAGNIPIPADNNGVENGEAAE